MSTAVTPHAERLHHKYGMSKLNAYDACPGYTPTEGTSAAAEEGTALHEIMERIIRDLKRPVARKHPMKSILVLEALRATGAVPMDDEQFALLVFCCQELDRWIAKGAVQFHNEISVQILRPDGSELNHGSLDLLLVLTDGKRAVLFDWKFGWLPVPPAETNLQGMGYALGVFNKFPAIQHLGIVFVQPKLGTEKGISYGSYKREQIYSMYSRIADVIRAAQLPDPPLRPNAYCDYCSRAGHCPALMAAARQAVSTYQPPPMPVSFSLDHLKTPKELATALWWFDRLETMLAESKKDDAGLKGAKERAMDLARAEGGTLEVEVQPGVVISMKALARKHKRSVTDPVLAMEALKDVISPAQFIECCDVSVTKLEDRVSTSAKEKGLTPTKKEGKELFEGVLSAEGLLTREDGLIEYLKVGMEKQTPALLENKPKTKQQPQ